jgi:cell division protein FtsI (penicillin-binding protein 3)
MRGPSSGSWLVTSSKEQVVDVDNRKIEKGKVPNVIGMGLKDAIYLLENEGLYVEFKGKGRVISQSLEANRRVTRGSLIKLELK